MNLSSWNPNSKRVYAHDEAKPNSCAENMVFTRESSLLFNHLSNRTTTEKELSILGWIIANFKLTLNCRIVSQETKRMMKLIKNLKQKSFPLYLHRRNVTNKHHTALPWTDDGLTNTKPRVLCPSTEIC